MKKETPTSSEKSTSSLKTKNYVVGGVLLLWIVFIYFLSIVKYAA